MVSPDMGSVWSYADHRFVAIGIFCVALTATLLAASLFLKIGQDLTYALMGLVGGYGIGVLGDEYRSAREKRASAYETEISRSAALLPTVQRQCYAWLLGYYIGATFSATEHESFSDYSLSQINQYLNSLALSDARLTEDIAGFYSYPEGKREKLVTELMNRLHPSGLMPFFQVSFLVASEPESSRRMKDDIFRLSTEIERAENRVLSKQYLQRILDYLAGKTADSSLEIKAYINSIQDLLLEWEQRISAAR